MYTILIVSLFAVVAANQLDWDSSTCQSLIGKKFSAHNRVTNGQGALTINDDFAKMSLCRHNFLREGAGLGLLKWNDGLAKFAKTWSQTQKNAGMNMYHSDNSQRDNLGGFENNGENLYISSSTGPTHPIYHAQHAADSWYSEIVWYNYGDSNQAYDFCPIRNKDIYNAIDDANGWPRRKIQLGHMTQLLWADTTDLGCDYSTGLKSGWNSIIVTCIYGPAGNWQGKAAFNESVAANLNSFSYNHKDDFEGINYGGIGSCETPDLSVSDNACAGQYGNVCRYPNQIGTCKDAEGVYGAPYCYLPEVGAYDICSTGTVDIDCNQ